MLVKCLGCEGNAWRLDEDSFQYVKDIAHNSTPASPFDFLFRKNGEFGIFAADNRHLYQIKNA